MYYLSIQSEKGLVFQSLETANRLLSALLHKSNLFHSSRFFLAAAPTRSCFLDVVLPRPLCLWESWPIINASQRNDVHGILKNKCVGIYLSAHQCPVSYALSAFPEGTLLVGALEFISTNTNGRNRLFSRAQAANMSPGIIVTVALFGIVAYVARIQLTTAGETEPTLGLAIMLASTLVRQRFTDDKCRLLSFLLF